MKKYEEYEKALREFFEFQLTEKEKAINYNILNELVEKEKPMKILHNNFCPVCNLIVNSDYSENGDMNYCPRCGQKLDLD